VLIRNQTFMPNRCTYRC